MKVFKILVIFLLLLTSFVVQAENKFTPATGYHNYAELSNALKALVSQNNKIASLTSIGKTGQGRDIWAIQISGTKGKSALEKQALLICGNLEADHVIGSEVALGIAQYLINGYGKNQEVSDLLDKRTFYIIPRANPDGAEMFFNNTLYEYSGNLTPRDEDYDWLTDEDGPEDLNGDGKITLMRVKDKDGDWFIEKENPRLLKKKEKDTPVDLLYKIYPEGLDNDGDELYNEDGPGGFNINRNFPHNFGYDIKGLKVYPASENETRAIIDFMNRYDENFQTAPYKNICGVLIFSKYDNLAAGVGIDGGEPTFPEVKKDDSMQEEMQFRFGRRRSREEQQPARAKDPQSKKTDDDDVWLFKQASEKYKEITGIEYAVSEKPVGSLLEWSYFVYGVPAFSANLWSLREEKKGRPDSTIGKKENQEKPEGTERRSMPNRKFPGRPAEKGAGKSESPNNDEKWLSWIDEQNNGVGFVNWEKFQHQQLGEVEIGGFYPYIKINPPGYQIDSLSQSHAKFALQLASQFADISMDEPIIKKMSSNLFKLKIKIHNNGDLPYASAMGLKTRNISPIVLQLKFEDEKAMKLFGGSKRIDTPTLAAGADKELEWVIISPPQKKVDVKLWARHGGGTTQTTVILK